MCTESSVLDLSSGLLKVHHVMSDSEYTVLERGGGVSVKVEDEDQGVGMMMEDSGPSDNSCGSSRDEEEETADGDADCSQPSPGDSADRKSENRIRHTGDYSI